MELDPVYERLRREEPVTRVRLPFGGEAWLVTRYDDAMTVMTDPRFSRAATIGREVPRLRLDDSGLRDSAITGMDPPRHTRVRALVGKAFTARRVELLRARAQAIVDGLLDEMAAQGPPADLVRGLALPLPVTVIAELLGVPPGDQDQFRGWSEAVLSTTAHTPEQVQEAYLNLAVYMAGQFDRRRAEPANDLLSELVSVKDGEGGLTEEELIVFGMTLLIAGYETTANQIANSVHTLLTDPDQADRLRRRPELLAGAVEELLRLVPIGTISLPSVATEDLELGGVIVRAGDVVFVSRASANLDEATFPAADRLDFERGPNPHVAFGYGPHHCLGAQLARMELQVAIGSLLGRFPGLALAVPAADLPWKTGVLVRGLRELPVRW